MNINIKQFILRTSSLNLVYLIIMKKMSIKISNEILSNELERLNKSLCVLHPKTNV